MVRLLLALVASLLATTLTACGGDPLPYDPTGVDQLEIPTASPDPDDFVDHVDNPWLPLTPGSSWSYDDGSAAGTQVQVIDDTREIAGVTTTAVETTTDGSTTTRFYAQDTDGNVWLFGEAGAGRAWEAGVAGAEAGLAMAAEPRVGDGYRQSYAEGVAEVRSTVVATDARVDVTAGEWGSVLQVEDVDDAVPGSDVRRFYVRGVGLVLEQEVGGAGQVALVEHRSP